MPRRTRLFFALALTALSTAACETIGNFADDVGSHMPTIGERCEHWQCFTESGRRQSEMNKRRRMMGDAAPPADSAAQPAPQAYPDAQGAQPQAYPAQQAYPGQYAQPAYGQQPAQPQAAQPMSPYDYYHSQNAAPPAYGQR